MWTGARINYCDRPIRPRAQRQGGSAECERRRDTKDNRPAMKPDDAPIVHELPIASSVPKHDRRRCSHNIQQRIRQAGRLQSPDFPRIAALVDALPVELNRPSPVGSGIRARFKQWRGCWLRSAGIRPLLFGHQCLPFSLMCSTLENLETSATATLPRETRVSPPQGPQLLENLACPPP